MKNNKWTFIKKSLLGVATIAIPMATSALGESPNLGYFEAGVAAFDPTPNSAILWTYYDTAYVADIWLAVKPKASLPFVASDDVYVGQVNCPVPNYHVEGYQMIADRCFVVKIDKAGLTPDTDYAFRFRDVGSHYSDIGYFKTAPAATSNSTVRILFGGDIADEANTTANGAHGIFTQMKLENANLFLALGDYYPDKLVVSDILRPAAGMTDGRVGHPTFASQNQSHAVASVQFIPEPNPDPDTTSTKADFGLASALIHRAPLRNFRGSLSTMAIWDNHETYHAAATSTAICTARYIDGLRAFKSFWPFRPNSNPTYAGVNTTGGTCTLPTTADKDNMFRNQKFGTGVEVFMLDSMKYQNTTNTRVGPYQLNWLKSSLGMSTSTWKIVAMTTLMNGEETYTVASEQANKMHYTGFSTAEREELMYYIRANRIKNVVFIGADTHQFFLYDIDEGQKFYGMSGLTMKPCCMSTQVHQIAHGNSTMKYDDLYDNDSKIGFANGSTFDETIGHYSGGYGRFIYNPSDASLSVAVYQYLWDKFNAGVVTDDRPPFNLASGNQKDLVWQETLLPATGNNTIQGPRPSGDYYIKNLLSGLYLKVNGTTVDTNSNVNNTTSHIWTFSPNPRKKGSFKITTKATGRTLTFGSNNLGTASIDYALQSVGNFNTNFALTSYGNNNYRIQQISDSPSTTLSFGARRFLTSNCLKSCDPLASFPLFRDFSRVGLATGNALNLPDDSSQLWTLVPVNARPLDGVYTISTLQGATPYYLEGYAIGAAGDRGAVLRTATSSNTQRWEISLAPDGVRYIISQVDSGGAQPVNTAAISALKAAGTTTNVDTVEFAEGVPDFYWYLTLQGNGRYVIKPSVNSATYMLGAYAPGVNDTASYLQLMPTEWTITPAN